MLDIVNILYTDSILYATFQNMGWEGKGWQKGGLGHYCTYLLMAVY